jgi:MoxR-like ATPase
MLVDETDVGRGEFIAFLDDLLTLEPGTLISIEGLPGIGKTFIVSRYVKSRFEAPAVNWIDCHKLSGAQSTLGSVLEATVTSSRRPSMIVVDGLDELLLRGS